MYIIGITGGTGAGKTTALKIIKDMDGLVLDCDAIYHEILANNDQIKSELETRFKGVIKNNGIDRKLLSEKVFNTPDALQDLNKITHKYVDDEVTRRIEDWKGQGGTLAAIDAIALIESGIGKRCDVVVGIVAPIELRISRIIIRDNITREQAEARIKAQKTDEFFKENCDILIEGVYNNPEEFENTCREVFVELIANAQKEPQGDHKAVT